MSDSPLLGLPYLAASQAQKHVTHNEALSLLDGVVQLAVISRSTATPPASPPDGARYLIATGATGEWAGQTGKLALRMEGAWRYLTPLEGWRCWMGDEAKLMTFDGTAWAENAVPTALQNLTLLGVNASADAVNKLTVASASTLFNHAGNGHQLKLNKNAATDTASLLLQSGFSGRAELGITGDDNLHVKVSADGASFAEALVIEAASGRLTIRKTALLDPQASDPASPADGQVWYNSTLGKFRLRQNGSTMDWMASGGGLADGDKGDLTVSGAGSVWTIDANVVANGKLAQMAANTLKGNNSASPANAADLAPSQVRSLLNVADGATANSADAALLSRANHTGTQVSASISDFAEAVDDRVAALLQAGSNISLAYNDAAGSLTIAASGSGGGISFGALKAAHLILN